VYVPLIMPLSTANAQIARAREAARPRHPHPPLLQRPLPQGTPDYGRRYSIAQRIQALTLMVEGFPWQHIQHRTGIPQVSQSNLKRKAIQRGFNPAVDPRITEYYVEDGHRSGRPIEVKEEVKQAVINNISADRSGREKSSEVLAYEAGISTSTALRILRDRGFKSVKPTRKPGLSKAQRSARLAWCLAHADWTLDDWKKVIWTDETAVILGHRRGTVRIWRSRDQGFEPTCIRERWKGYSEFMFWGAFSYNFKGPYHIYQPETARMKREAQEWCDIMNTTHEDQYRQDWELENGIRRLNLRRRSGKLPKWRFTAKTGKLMRNGRGGVDFYRYCQF
jgi:hypothetical protein